MPDLLVNTVVVPDDLLEVAGWVKGKQTLQEWVESCVRWTLSSGAIEDAARRLARTNNRTLGNPTLDGLILHRKDGPYMGADIFCWHCGVRGVYMKTRPPDLGKSIYHCRACGRTSIIEELGPDGKRITDGRRDVEP